MYDLCEEAVYSQDTADDSLRVIRTSDGETAELIPVASDFKEEIRSSVLHAGDMAFSPDGHTLALPLFYYNKDTEKQSGALLLADLKNHSRRIIRDAQMPCQEVCFLENKAAVVFGCQDESLTSLYDSETQGKISCYDPDSGQLIWEKELLLQMQEQDSRGLLPFTAVIEEKEQQTLLLWCGRRLLLFDIGSGKELWSLTCGEKVVRVQPWNGKCIAGTESGSLFRMDPADQSLQRLGTNAEKRIRDFIYDPSSQTAFLIASEEGSVVLLKRMADEPEEVIRPEDSLSQVSAPENGPCYAVYTKEEDLTGEIAFYGMEDHEKKSVLPVGYEIWQPGQWICGIKENGDPAEEAGIFCWIEDVSGTGRITAYDVTEQKILWQRQTDYSPSEIRFCRTLQGEEWALLYPKSSSSGQTILLLDLRTGETFRRILLTDEQSEQEEKFCWEADLSPAGRYLLAVCSGTPAADEKGTARLQIYDTELESWLALPEELSAPLSPSYVNDIIWTAQGKEMAALYVEGKNQILLLDLTELKVLQHIPFYGSSQRQAVFLPGDLSLLLWGDDGILKLWDTEQECVLMEDTQKLYSVSEISLEEGSHFIEIHGTDEENLDFFYENSVWFYLWEEGGRFYPYTRLKNGFYVSGTNRICSITGEGEIYWYEHYSLDELLEKAKKIIGTETLTIAERNKYFISAANEPDGGQGLLLLP